MLAYSHAGFACKSADKLSGMANSLPQNRIFPSTQLVSHLLKSFEYNCLQNCKALEPQLAVSTLHAAFVMRAKTGNLGNFLEK